MCCMVFRDLKKACHRNNLSSVFILINVTVGHVFLYELFQIKMHPYDIEEINFITPKAYFYYKVVPFRLKNGREYQMTMTVIFHDILHDCLKIMWIILW